ncbi:hypothetical protein BJV78DRAFT_1276034 [Lactifluus subvellereus]|nr:hypothetical protein BJV78DRAFT_1276034 [Lactifluus subvellereus]
MFFSRLASFAVISTLIGSAVANFQFLSPGGPDLWWVAQSENTLVWACRDNPPAASYTLLVNNTNPTILAAPEAIVANIPNADCSHSITLQQAVLTPATGYTVIFADILDQTKIYAVSKPFEVKALGATYPSASATPADDPLTSTAGAASGSSTASGASASSTSNTNKSNGAFATFEVSAAGVLAALGAAIGML